MVLVSVEQMGGPQRIDAAHTDWREPASTVSLVEWLELGGDMGQGQIVIHNFQLFKVYG